MEENPKNYVVFTDANGKKVNVGMMGDEHTAQSKLNNRDPFVCMKQDGKWGGRRFCYGELKKVGEEFDPNTHEMDHDLHIFRVFLGDDGAYKHEFDMTLVGRLFFSDFQCMNRSYCGISRDSCVDAANPSMYGCGSIMFHAKKGLVNGDLAISTRYAKYDRAKSGGSLLPYHHELVKVLPTARQIRKMLRMNEHLDPSDFEDLPDCPTYVEYRWNIMADRLMLYALRNGWKRGPNGNKGICNIVEKENCIGEDYSDSDTEVRCPYLWQWWKIMLGLLKPARSSESYHLTEEQKERLEKIGVSFHLEDVEAIDEILQRKGQEGVQVMVKRTSGQTKGRNSTGARLLSRKKG